MSYYDNPQRMYEQINFAIQELKEFRKLNKKGQFEKSYEKLRDARSRIKCLAEFFEIDKYLSMVNKK